MEETKAYVAVCEHCQQYHDAHAVARCDGCGAVVGKDCSYPSHQRHVPDFYACVECAHNNPKFSLCVCQETVLKRSLNAPSPVCQACQEAVCDGCASRCRRCRCFMHKSCLLPCKGCGHFICSMCSRNTPCSKCEGTICRDCPVRHCQACDCDMCDSCYNTDIIFCAPCSGYFQALEVEDKPIPGFPREFNVWMQSAQDITMEDSPMVDRLEDEKRWLREEGLSDEILDESMFQLDDWLVQ